MYEDAEIERAAFRGRGRIFSIASAGDTALALAGEHEVLACDINPVQLGYARSRAAGGPRANGDADRAMALARRLMPLIGWRKNLLRTFLEFEDTARQIAFWQQHLDTARFRAGLRLLLSRPLLRTIYTPALLASLPWPFAPVIRSRLARGFGRHANASNPYARALLCGEEAGPPPPPAGKIEFVAGDAAAVLETRPAGSLDGVSLSNILDGTGPAYRARLAAAVRHAAVPDAPVVMRSFAEPPPGLAGNQAELDRSLLWGVVEVRRAGSL
jgi:S-adenosylmethionine:diacylglycerol 3-amino-3-carboxypropyl transferase